MIVAPPARRILSRATRPRRRRSSVRHQSPDRSSGNDRSGYGDPLEEAPRRSISDKAWLVLQTLPVYRLDSLTAGLQIGAAVIAEALKSIADDELDRGDFVVAQFAEFLGAPPF
jgi:hypothetical protein